MGAVLQGFEALAQFYLLGLLPYLLVLPLG
jgi:hypothetical protein